MASKLKFPNHPVLPYTMRQMYLDSLSKQTKKHFVFKNIPMNTQCSLSGYSNIWVISDTHLYHKNVIKYSNRPFSNEDEMVHRLIQNYNSVVHDDDVVIWVGDVALCDNSKADEVLNQLNGDRILVLGNHDFFRNNLKHMSFDYYYLMFLHGPLVFTHYPFKVPDGYINIHGHAHDSNIISETGLNVSVEAINYTPINLTKLEEYCGN